jgi:hypothetical protein
LDRDQPVDPLVVGKGLVIVGDNSKSLLGAEVQQRGMP